MERPSIAGSPSTKYEGTVGLMATYLRICSIVVPHGLMRANANIGLRRSIGVVLASLLPRPGHRRGSSTSFLRILPDHRALAQTTVYRGRRHLSGHVRRSPLVPVSASDAGY